MRDAYQISTNTARHRSLFPSMFKNVLGVHQLDYTGRFSFPPSTPRFGLSTPFPGFCARFGLLAVIARSPSKLSSSKAIPPPSHFSSSRLGSARRSIRSGDSTIGGKRARDSLDPRAGGVLVKPARDAADDDESPEVSESNLVTNAASARRSSSNCCRA
jgi:hypothetical protein